MPMLMVSGPICTVKTLFLRGAAAAQQDDKE